ncbi:MAG: hypothetical protein PUI87_02950 [Mycoplasmataceae bacterium]|nr:hypothetical protein [Mycoplasmataceae bacterium]
MANSLDVLKFYEQDIKPAIQKNSNEYIQNLIKSTNFNNDYVSKLEQSISEDNKLIDNYNRNIINKPKFRSFLRFILVVSILGIIASIVWLSIESAIITGQSTWIILLIISVLLLFISIIGFIARSDAKNKIAPVIARRDKNVNSAKKELVVITKLISKKECQNLLEKSFPKLTINDIFTDTDANLWEDELEDHETSSILSAIHGTINCSPYLFLTNKRIEIIDKEYTGWTTIYVEEEVYNPNTHSYETETVEYDVSASITRPKPSFPCDSRLYLKTKIYPNLEYYNLKPFLSKSSIKKFYKQNDHQKLMENPEFDLFFPCIRNNEIQFKATFQLYAQEQIVELIKNRNIHKLQMKKTGDTIQVECDNPLTCSRINLFGESFLDYSIDRITKNFNITMYSIMDGLYAYFLSILAVSLYQNEKYYIDTEKLSKNNPNTIKFNLEDFFNSNEFFDSKYFHPNTSNIVFDAIPKFKVIYKTKTFTIASMDACSFSHTPRTHYETVHAYGETVDVPIEWNEYKEIHVNYLVLSFLVNDNKHDFRYPASEDNELKKHSIIEVFKSINRVCLVFHPDIKSINEPESLIEIIKTKFKLS